MKGLIKIEVMAIGDRMVNTVDARMLHTFLGSKQQFSNWITNRVQSYDFTEHTDFATINNSICSPPRTEYALTMNMAKELSMVERNARGKQARKYFIECEEKLKGQTYLERHNLPNFMDPAISARAWAEQVELKQVALKERDEAVRLRRCISDKKTATAMNTASRYSKENVKLRKELAEAADIFAQLNQFVVGRGACLTIS